MCYQVLSGVRPLHFSELMLTLTSQAHFGKRKATLSTANCRTENQLYATYYSIVLLVGSTCFGHYYAHHQELATLMLVTTLVILFLVCCMLEVSCG